MKRSLLRQTLTFGLVVIAGIGSSCQSSCQSRPPATANANIKGPNNVNHQPGNTNNTGKDDKTGNGSSPAVDADMVMIVHVDNDVRLRPKGAAEFGQVFHAPFFFGDLLRVGDSSTAWVECNGSECPLGKGDYTKCCGGTCENGIPLRPPEGAQLTPMMRKTDLPPRERQAFDTSEKRIRTLGADEVTTQYLIANLYSSWKVAEASQEVDKLSQQLKDPEAAKKMNKLYLPMVNRTGDMYLKMDKKGQAEENYKKVVELAPQTKDDEQKAAAHVALGQLYKDSGRKAEAVQNLQQGQQIYEKQGNVKKADETRRAIAVAQKQ